MNEWLRMNMGLVPPKTPEELAQQATLEGMRAAIWKALHESPVVRACLGAARYRGLNGEDTYTLLAYHALLALEDHYQRHVDILGKMPVPPILATQRGTE